MKGHVMRAQMKSAPAQIKAAGDGDGIVEALVATYAVDSGGDRIVPGAFADTLDEWAASGKTMPFIWAHQHDDIDAYLGDVLEAKEVDDGLYVKAQVDMEDPKSAKAYRLMKSGRVDNYSFAYEVKDAEPDPDDESVTLLKTIGLFEVGPVLIGMNRETRTLAVKRDGQASDEPLPTVLFDGTLSAQTSSRLQSRSSTEPRASRDA
jgi:HK97 family phage prohead protease